MMTKAKRSYCSTLLPSWYPGRKDYGREIEGSDVANEEGREVYLGKDEQ